MLVSNDTGHAAIGDLLALSDDEWHAGLDLLLNVIRMACAVTPIMERQGGGAIVNISSYNVGEPPFPMSSVSGSLREVMTCWMKTYSDAYGPKGIRMNNVLPGWMENAAGKHGDRSVDSIPLRRLGRMEELGQAIAFLASSGGAYITGQSLRVDDGLARSF